MSNISDIYIISLRSARQRFKKALRENEQCYSSLKNKDSEYARIVKALQDLHRSAYEIYKNAPDEIEKPRSEDQGFRAIEMIDGNQNTY